MKKIIASLLIFLLPVFAFAGVQTAQPTNIEVRGFANEALMAAYDLNFSNHDKQQELASHYFSPKAWKIFQNMLAQTHLLELVDSKPMIVSASAESSPVIISMGAKGNGTAEWNLEFPAVILYNEAESSEKHHVMIKMDITSGLKTSGVRGMIVDQMTITPAQ